MGREQRRGSEHIERPRHLGDCCRGFMCGVGLADVGTSLLDSRRRRGNMQSCSRARRTTWCRTAKWSRSSSLGPGLGARRMGPHTPLVQLPREYLQRERHRSCRQHRWQCCGCHSSQRHRPRLEPPNRLAFGHRGRTRADDGPGSRPRWSSRRRRPERTRHGVAIRFAGSGDCRRRRTSRSDCVFCRRTPAGYSRCEPLGMGAWDAFARCRIYERSRHAHVCLASQRDRSRRRRCTGRTCTCCACGAHADDR